MKLIIKLTLIIVCFSCIVFAESSKSNWRLHQEEAKATKLYQKGEFEKAFKILQPLAKLGLKQAQYFVAFSYMKGQGQKADPITGMAWLGVAIESKIPQWVSQYQQAISLLNTNQKIQLATRQKHLIALYGMKKQHIICEVRLRSTRAHNKKAILCFKDRIDNIESFDI